MARKGKEKQTKAAELEGTIVRAGQLSKKRVKPIGLPTELEQPPGEVAVVQIGCKQRVAEYGEVLTAPREVNAMLDLVKQETERIESRFLEPACGTGNFLVEVLRRKLTTVATRYRKSQLEWERNAIVAMASLYGIDIQDRNARTCRQVLFDGLDAEYLRLFDRKIQKTFRASVRYILERNIVWGDALTLKTVGSDPGPIVFSEWSPMNGSLIKRREYAFHELLSDQPQGARFMLDNLQKSLFGEDQASLFAQPEPPLISDTGQRVFIPKPVRDYPLVHYLEIAYGYD